MSFVLGELAAIYVDVGIKGFILVPIFVVIMFWLKRWKLLLIGLIGCLFFCISYYNTKYYTEDIKSWNGKKENEKVIVSGYIDDIVNKNKVTYVYIDDIFILMNSQLSRGLYIGNYIEIHGVVCHFSKASNEGNFDEEKYYNSLGFTKKIKALRVRVIDDKRDAIKEIVGTFKESYVRSICKIWEEDNAGLICGITIGYKEDISDVIKEKYRVLGISHILAISGLHLSIVGMGIFKLFRRRFGYLVSGISAIIVILLFGVLIGDSASISRALIMFVMHIIALIIGRTYDMISATSLAAVIIMLSCPYVIYNAGFLLSFGAIISICILGNIIENTNAFTFTGTIQVVTLPLTMMIYYEIPTYGVLVNLIVVPTVGVLVVSGLLSGIIGIFCVEVGYFISGIGKLILWFYDKLYELVETFPYNNIVTGKVQPWLVVFYYFIIIIIFTIVYLKKRKRYLFLCVPLILLVLYLNEDKSFYFCVLDVGQGDCLIIHNEANSVYIIDSGSSDVSELYEYRIKSTLKAKGIDKINGLIITHTDTDHISAVEDMLEDGIVDCLYLPQITMKDNEYVDLENIANEYGVEIRYLLAGMKLISGRLELKCMYPFIDSKSNDVNELSTVIKIAYGDMDILCMGDLGSEGESVLMSKYLKDELECDVLKVGHHGSKYSSSTEFLKMTSPRLALISCGKNNSYGHPHEETLERLKRFGIEILATKDVGEVVLAVQLPTK